MADHASRECAGRATQCRYCSLEVKLSTLQDHEAMCGFVTEKCHRCNARIPRKAIQDHEIVCSTSASPPKQTGFDFGRYDAVKPTVSPLKRSMYICPTCNTNIEGLDELQVHILITHPEVMVDSQSDKMDHDSQEKVEMEE